MILSSLHVRSFRCFKEKTFDFDAKFNFISGPNGAGKTALLEAISLLSTGRSFRIREVMPLIQSHENEMTLFAKLENGYSISLKKSVSSSPQIKINTQVCLRTSELTAFLPSQVIYQDLFQIIDAGPVIRRQLLDWGLFHVKQNYHTHLQQYRQALKQRNALLKRGAKPASFEPWNQTLSELGEWIHEVRLDYFNALKPIFSQKLRALTSLECELDYFKGWDKEVSNKSYVDHLEASYLSDLQRQYTQVGPHQADIHLNTTSGKVKYYLSRGQQKMVLMALKLAQAQILSKPCLYIWDDVCSELDTEHLEKLGTLIQELPGQFFISGIDLGRGSLAQRNAGMMIELK